MKDQLLELIKSLRPVRTEHELIRIGGDNDGGYLVPDDLKGITECFSPGVDVTATFEKDLLKYDIKSHLADASVDGVPEGLKAASFTKRYLGGINSDTVMTLDTWVTEYSLTYCDLILQMDIEGAEYVTLLSTPKETLNRFRIIVLEIHDVFYWFNNAIAWNTVTSFFSKLLADYYVVHMHPNNNCPFIKVDDDIEMPTVFELTLIRKDRAHPTGYCDTFPHPLDQPNVTDKPDRPLPASMYGEAV